MKPKLYLFPTLASMTTPFVQLEDYQQLEKESKCLLHTLEVKNDKLYAAEQEIACTKWQRDNLQGALDSLQDSYDKLAEKYTAEQDRLTEDVIYWQRQYKNTLRDKMEAEKKLDAIQELF